MKSDYSLVFIDPKPTLPEDGISVDLCLADALKATKQEKHLIKKNEQGFLLEIKSLSSVVVKTKEIIGIPQNVFGVVMPSGRMLLDKGIIMASTKVEPSFFDHLTLLLFNTTNKNVILNDQEIVASVVFYSMDDVIECKKHFNKYLEKNVIIYTKWKRILHFTARNIATIISILALIATVWMALATQMLASAS